MAVSLRSGSKYYYIQFQYNNKTYLKSSKTTDKQLAESLEAQWRKQLIEQHQLGIKSPIEIDKAFQLFSKSKSQIVSHKYTDRWCRRASAYWSNLTYIHQVQTKEIEQFRLDMQTNGYSNQSIKHALNQIGGTIRYMKKLGYQVSDVEMPSIKLPKGRLRYLSYEEEQRLLAVADPTRDIKWMAPYENRRSELKRMMQDFYDLVVVLLDTGARHGEVCSLEWDRIDLDKRTIGLWRSKVQNESVLYMTDRVHQILIRRYDDRLNKYVFTNKRGGARGNLTLIFQKAFKRAGIEGCSAHTLRHTHATRLIQNGLNIYEVKEILGHSDIKTTMRYAHIEQEKVTLRARDVIDALNNQNKDVVTR